MRRAARRRRRSIGSARSASATSSSETGPQGGAWDALLDPSRARPLRLRRALRRRPPLRSAVRAALRCTRRRRRQRRPRRRGRTGSARSRRVFAVIAVGAIVAYARPVARLRVPRAAERRRGVVPVRRTARLAGPPALPRLRVSPRCPSPHTCTGSRRPSTPASHGRTADVVRARRRRDHAVRPSGVARSRPGRGRRGRRPPAPRFPPGSTTSRSPRRTRSARFLVAVVLTALTSPGRTTRTWPRGDGGGDRAARSPARPACSSPLLVVGWCLLCAPPTGRPGATSRSCTVVGGGLLALVLLLDVTAARYDLVTFHNLLWHGADAGSRLESHPARPDPGLVRRLLGLRRAPGRGRRGGVHVAVGCVLISAGNRVGFGRARARRRTRRPAHDRRVGAGRIRHAAGAGAASRSR